MTDEKEKKPANELTTDEVMNELFPPEVVEHLKEEVRKQDAPKVKAKSSCEDDN
jgi:hypothetical protein